MAPEAGSLSEEALAEIINLDVRRTRLPDDPLKEFSGKLFLWEEAKFRLFYGAVLRAAFPGNQPEWRRARNGNEFIVFTKEQADSFRHIWQDLPRVVVIEDMTRLSIAIDFNFADTGARKRSEVGDLVYRAKYKADSMALSKLCQQAASCAQSIRVLSGVNHVVPIPSAAVASGDTVPDAVAQAIASALKAKYSPDILRTIVGRPTLKNLAKPDRARALQGTIAPGVVPIFEPVRQDDVQPRQHGVGAMTHRAALAWLALRSSKGIGSKTLAQLYHTKQAAGQSIEELLTTPPEVLRDLLRPAQARAFLDVRADLGAVERRMQALVDGNIGFLTLEDPRFPALLSSTLAENCPPILYYRGPLDNLEKPTVAIVGSRKAAPRSLAIARRAAWGLSHAGIHVISGYASGVDNEAHRGALEAQGATTAVLPYGLGHFKWRVELSRHLAGASTLLLSACDPGVAWSAGAAMERNKTICALSRAVLVIAARDTGGTVDEAATALRQGRPLFVVEYSSYDAGTEGNKRLLAQGAIPVRRARTSEEANIESILGLFGDHERQPGATPQP